MKAQNEKDPLWDVLSNASEQKPDAHFSHNVMREVRNLPAHEPWWKAFKLPQLATATAAIALTLGVVFIGADPQHANPTNIVTKDVGQTIPPTALSENDLDDILTPISVVAHLDTTDFDEFQELLEL
ncbi:hypothetical protein [Rubritalea marina]|uniref:hypothetical protein n=1 Tax=Rubritalea marina TaxID=361055 RepID=UPI00036AD431|nr:hypothetical protein [Rubritalea marina]